MNFTWHAYPEELPAEEGEYLVTNGEETWVAFYGTFRDSARYDYDLYDKEYVDEDLSIPETLGFYVLDYGMAIYWGHAYSVQEIASPGVIAWGKFPTPYKKEEF